jgi:peptidoglycan/xylan/chitin deacetylase (PgdA/CDA1 family)
MIRSLLKAGTASVLHGTRMDRMLGSLTGSRRLPLILGYHRVVEDFSESARISIPSLLIGRQMLERHLEWVGRHYRFVDLDDLGARLESGEGLERPLAAVTFDDGYSDFHHQAVPLLRKKGIPATVFVVTGSVGATEPQVHDTLYLLLTRRAGRDVNRPWNGPGPLNIDDMTPYQAVRRLIETLPLAGLLQVIQTLKAEDAPDKQELESLRSLNWEELHSIRREGFAVGSHTRSHIVMTNESPSCVEKELSESRAELENGLGAPIRHFAYPSGLFDVTSVKAVASAGYRFGYTGCLHRSTTHPLLTVPRTHLWENSSLDSNHTFSGAVLSCQIHRAFDLVNGCRQHHEAVN